MKMIADFSNALWDTRIESDTISSDGYEVSNLISRDNVKKRRGFLAERFVKPVVSILISFPFPIDVIAINVNPQVGAQKICGLEILSASLKCCGRQSEGKICSNPNVNGQNGPNKPNDQAFHSYQHVLNANNIKEELKTLFNQILRVRMVEGKVGNFVNPCSKEAKGNEFSSRILGLSPSGIQSCNLQQGNRLHNTSHLWIRITQVHKGSVPCLGALEVVGKPARNNSKFVADYARCVTLRLKQEREGTVFKECTATSSKTNDSEPVCQNDPCTDMSSVDNVPAEFIDPITFNIMTLPILLPSGNTIDNSTLEKHIATERNWGRQPSDPFTGIPLGSKVVPNAALKYRIDRFLLSANIKLDEFGRTVGSSSDCKSTAKLKFDAILRQHKHKISSGKRKACEMNVEQPSLKRQNPGKEKHISVEPSSLDLALENVLNSGQKSTDTPSVNTSSIVESSFNQTTTGSSHGGCPHEGKTDVLFQLPCQHVMCRQCLTCAIQTKQCICCQADFERKDVVRVHSKRTSLRV
ncbi:RING finger protein 37-like [Dendronephthya gigantea]|uniref:RING finger protein 37-like n=1 Tax=Dendronephthya gigantea TaxID=151771 RepID=UPI00106AB291|nr:RING finger protein 37-like [Dendronephthya gigantea]